jgi:signal transduction histidine kinase
LLALLAERTALEGITTTDIIPPAPATLVPKLGQYLLEQGLLTEDQLDQALIRQKKLASKGTRQLLGRTLIEMRMVDRETLDRAITSQIVELHAAVQEANRTLERRVAERTSELRRALERLTELNQIKANLISNVSHELRTPLAHIKGYLELFQQEQLGPLVKEQQEAMQVVKRATDRLERLIDDLIEFSTASREGMNLNLEPVNVGEIAESVMDRSREKAEKAGVQLEFNTEENLQPILVDREKLIWVLYQLIDNGIKFTPSGGNVKVLAESKNQNVVSLAVADSGIGIPNDRMEEIFEPFHQLDGSPTRRYGGTGLGLALVKQILHAHNASLHVESEENSGSVFRFDLPIAKTSQ